MHRATTRGNPVIKYSLLSTGLSRSYSNILHQPTPGTYAGVHLGFKVILSASASPSIPVVLANRMLRATLRHDVSFTTCGFPGGKDFIRLHLRSKTSL